MFRFALTVLGRMRIKFGYPNTVFRQTTQDEAHHPRGRRVSRDADRPQHSVGRRLLGARGPEHAVGIVAWALADERYAIRWTTTEAGVQCFRLQTPRGYLESVDDWWEDIPDVHGDILIYTLDGNVRVEFRVRSTDGVVSQIKEVDRATS